MVWLQNNMLLVVGGLAVLYFVFRDKITAWWENRKNPTNPLVGPIVVTDPVTGEQKIVNPPMSAGASEGLGLFDKLFGIFTMRLTQISQLPLVKKLDMTGDDLLKMVFCGGLILMSRWVAENLEGENQTSAIEAINKLSPLFINPIESGNPPVSKKG